MERQELAIARWLEAHPQYELDREIKAVGSGAGRFEWFIKELQEADCLKAPALWWKISRFSREPVTESTGNPYSAVSSWGA